MSEKIDISDVSKEDLAYALWLVSKPAAFFRGFPPSATREEVIEDCVQHEWNLDYVVGRVMKIDLGGNEVDPQWYDKHNEPGQFKNVSGRVRSGTFVYEDKVDRYRLIPMETLKAYLGIQ